MQFRIPGMVLLTAAVFVCVFVGSDLPTVNNMEARNYITAREILQDGSWLLPTMNGELRIAKPPLPTWITALAMKAAGTDADLVANRLPAGICRVLLVLFTFLVVRRITGDRRLAVTSVLVLATGQLFLWTGRRNFWDIYAVTSMAGAIWALAEVFARREGKMPYLLLLTFFMAFSFLSKGPVALWAMFIPFLAGYWMACGAGDLKANMKWFVPAAGIAVLLAGTWPLYVYFNTPQDAMAVASRETANWFSYHREPPWYYLLNLHWVTGPWLSFLLYAAVAPLVGKGWSRSEKLFVFWFILTIVFLSIVPEKKIRYLMPALVPAAAVSAMAILRLRETGDRAWKLVYGPFCMVSGIAFLVVAGMLVFRYNHTPAAVAGAFGLTVAGGVILSNLIRKHTRNTHLVVVAGLCLCLVLITPLKEEILGRDGTIVLMELRDNPEIEGRELYFIGDPSPELIWASGRKIRPLPEGEASIPKVNPAGAAVITTSVLDGSRLGLRLVETIPVQEKVYYVYSPLKRQTR